MKKAILFCCIIIAMLIAAIGNAVAGECVKNCYSYIVGLKVRF